MVTMVTVILLDEQGKKTKKTHLTLAGAVLRRLDLTMLVDVHHSSALSGSVRVVKRGFLRYAFVFAGLPGPLEINPREIRQITQKQGRR